MYKIIRKLQDFIHISIPKNVVSLLNEDEIRRIRMVNYISLIAIGTMMSYIGTYVIIDFSLFKTAILFLSSMSLLLIGTMLINYLGYYRTSKILVLIVNSFAMGSIATWIFGKDPDFQTYLLVSAIIPLFLYSVKNLGMLIIAIGINIIAYILIEFLPLPFDSMIELPENYILAFHSTNILVCFMGAGLAIVFYMILAINKEKSLVVRTRELEESKRYQDIIYSVIAHDLRTPFNSLIGMSKLLHDEYENYDDFTIKKAIHSFHESSQSANYLLENLLGWSKLKSGSHKVNSKIYKLENIIQDTLFFMNGTADEKNITVRNQVDSNIEVKADSYMIATVIRNLISNAMKFTPKGGTISISATKTKDTVIVCVTDTGVGIDITVIPTIFDLSPTEITHGTNNEKGSGLGLKLCREFIHAHRGKIWVESEITKGSKFYFSLPIG